VFALDTNTVSYFFRGAPSVIAAFDATSPQDIGIPDIVRYELKRGLLSMPASRARTERMTALDALLAAVRPLPFNDAAADAAAAIHAQLAKIGLTIGPLDTLIAATAMAFDATLVTNNQREFARVKKLALANWLKT
jgi:tRNA(fMet)-specific endonuclease VapC